jgi:type IV pilus assembly protein PilF
LSSPETNFGWLAVSVLIACAPAPKPEIEAWPMEERAQAHVDLGLSYLQRDKLDIARESFSKALEVNPRSSEANHGLGLVEAKALNLSLARNYLQRSVTLDSQNVGAVSDYAIMLCKSDSASQGVDLLENNIKQLDLVGLPTKLAFGRCYEANDQLGKAIAAYKEVLKLDPERQQALLSMAHLKFDAKIFLSSSAFLQRYFYTNAISSDALL